MENNLARKQEENFVPEQNAQKKKPDFPVNYAVSPYYYRTFCWGCVMRAMSADYTYQPEKLTPESCIQGLHCRLIQAVGENEVVKVKEMMKELIRIGANGYHTAKCKAFRVMGRQCLRDNNTSLNT